MQKWFSSGAGDTQNSPQQIESSSSLLSDWNSYAAARSPEESSSGGPLAGVFDIEAAVRSANDTVSGTFNVVSKGVRDLPGNFQSATSTIPSGKALMYFGLLLASGVFFVFIAFTLFLPVIVLVPQKFALCFTVGCAFIIGSFFALRGPKNQFNHMSSKERLPFTLGFIGSMIGTIYVSMVLHSYVLSVLFSVLQVLALAYYAISYFPGGSTGLKFISSSLTSSILKCFGRERTRLLIPRGLWNPFAYTEEKLDHNPELQLSIPDLSNRSSIAEKNEEFWSILSTRNKYNVYDNRLRGKSAPSY